MDPADANELAGGGTGVGVSDGETKGERDGMSTSDRGRSYEYQAAG